MKLYIPPIAVELTDEQWDVLTDLSTRLGKTRNRLLAEAAEKIMQASLVDLFLSVELVDGKQN